MPPASGGFVVENFCISAASGRSPIPPCSPSRLVALSRCPDARVSLPVSGSRRQWHEGDQRVITGRDGWEQGLQAFVAPAVLRQPSQAVPDGLLTSHALPT